LPPAHADQRRRRHIAVPDSLRDRSDDAPACDERSDRRHRPCGASGGRRRRWCAAGRARRLAASRRAIARALRRSRHRARAAAVRRAGHDARRHLFDPCGDAMKRWALAVAMVLSAWFGPAARADDLVSGLSTDLIQITSNFTGTEIVLFGAIEPTEDTG